MWHIEKICSKNKIGSVRWREGCGKVKDNGIYFIQQHVQQLHEHEPVKELKSITFIRHLIKPCKKQMISNNIHLSQYITILYYII